MHKHNVKPSDEKDADERIKRARKARNAFFEKENELGKTKYSSEDDTSEFESDVSDIEYVIDSTNSVKEVPENVEIKKDLTETLPSIETRETQYCPNECFVSLHEKYDQGTKIKLIHVNYKEVQARLESERCEVISEQSTWFPGINFPTKV